MWSTGALPQNHDLPKHRADDPPIQDALQPSPPTPKVLPTPSPFVAETLAGTKAKEGNIKSTLHPLTSLSALTLLSNQRNTEKRLQDMARFHRFPPAGSGTCGLQGRNRSPIFVGWDVARNT